MNRLYTLTAITLALLAPALSGAHERQNGAIEQGSLPALNFHAGNSHATDADNDSNASTSMQWRRLPAKRLARLHIDARNTIKT